MLHFAVAGSPRSTPPPGGTLRGLERAAELGITAMELEWVQSVPKNPEHMEVIRAKAVSLNIALTVHAPYYVNLNAHDEKVRRASIRRILDALTMAQLAGARSVCVHPAFYLGDDPEDVYEQVSGATKHILSHKDVLFPGVNLAYETMGKPSQFGTLEEVLRVSREHGIYPCIDPAHMHARSNGQWNTAQEWNDMFDLTEEYLGTASLQHVHMHYSGIAYSEKGERKHLSLRESDARWEDFLRVLHDRHIEGTLVCESPIQEEDTLLLMQGFLKLKSP